MAILFHQQIFFLRPEVIILDFGVSSKENPTGLIKRNILIKAPW